MSHCRTARGALFALPFFVAFAAAGCGENLLDDDDGEEETFTATLTALNGSGVTGVVEIRTDEDDDEFELELEADGTAPSIVHQAHIRVAASCPTAAADANADGYVDVMEGVPSYGLILIPLDDNLGSQTSGAFATSAADGSLELDSETSFDMLLSDLQASDPDPDDAIVKLTGALDLTAMTVVIHGVDPTTDLPSTVASLGTAPATTTLPIACGEIS
jgi:hypothetical protein